MYTGEDIKLLNKLRRLGASNFQRKYKITYKEALKCLHAIVEDHTNVFFESENVIYIYDPSEKKEKKIKLYKGWKDVTKP